MHVTILFIPIMSSSELVKCRTKSCKNLPDPLMKTCTSCRQVDNCRKKRKRDDRKAVRDGGAETRKENSKYSRPTKKMPTNEKHISGTRLPFMDKCLNHADDSHLLPMDGHYTVPDIDNTASPDLADETYKLSDTESNSGSDIKVT
jgi:hypothetical protein